MARFISAMAAVAVASLATPAWSATLVDTGTQEGNNGGGFTILNTQYLAGQFTLDSAAVLTNIETYIATSQSNSIALTLYTNASGLPGTSLFSSSFIADPNENNGAWQGLSGLNWAVASGTYWLSIEAQSGVTGFVPHHVPNPLAAYAFNVNDQGWRNTSYYPFGLRIADNSGIGAVPEPSTWALMLLGFFALGFTMRQRKIKQNVSVSYA